MNATLNNTDEIRNRRKEPLLIRLRSITVVFIFGLWTAVTLGGSVWGFIFLNGPNSVTRSIVISSDNTILHLVAALLVYLCGGGLWGLGIARLMNSDAKSMMKACALSWSATGFTFAIALVLSLPVIHKIIRILPHCCHSTHYLFLSIFVPVIGFVTAINTYVATGKLGFKELKKLAALRTGIAAALGFLSVGLILLYGLGWEVGYPMPGKYGMLLLALICSIGAALTGGMAIGWMLSRAGSAQESQLENMQA